MTQEQADAILAGDLGRQLESIYVTADDRAFIRAEEAVWHALGEDGTIPPLADPIVIEWGRSEAASRSLCDFPA